MTAAGKTPVSWNFTTMPSVADGDKRLQALNMIDPALAAQYQGGGSNAGAN